MKQGEEERKGRGKGSGGRDISTSWQFYKSFLHEGRTYLQIIGTVFIYKWPEKKIGHHPLSLENCFKTTTKLHIPSAQELQLSKNDMLRSKLVVIVNCSLRTV